MTHRKLLKEISTKLTNAGIETANLDARVLIKFVLQIDDTVLFKNFDQTVNKKVALKILELADRRAEQEPIAYLTKQKEFYGLNFYVNNTVLIPRPETEWLVEESIKFLNSKLKNKKINVIDVGTGSGNIITAIAKNFSEADFFAIDNSLPALKVAVHNAKQNGVASKIIFLESDLFSNQDLPQKFDLITANLPYVPESGADISTKFEPPEAIFAKDNGTKIIKKFLEQAKSYLNTDGLILIELDPRNAQEILKHSQKIGYKSKLENDLAGHARYLEIALSS